MQLAHIIQHNLCYSGEEKYEIESEESAQYRSVVIESEYHNRCNHTSGNVPLIPVAFPAMTYGQPLPEGRNDDPEDSQPGDLD